MSLVGFSGEALGYGGGAVLSDLRLQLARGERLVLLGRSGAGKTTLLNAVYDRLVADGHRVALAPQDHALVPQLSVLRNVLMGRLDDHGAVYNLTNLIRPRRADRVAVAEQEVARRQAEYDRAFVRAPFAGRVIDVTAKTGEAAGANGVLELANVSQMYAIAEVYETDIRWVRVGQKARVTSDALAKPISGTVTRIRPKVKKLDEIGTDPAARKDARIIEVEVRLDDSKAVAALSLLQVEVEIGR